MRRKDAQCKCEELATFRLEYEDDYEYEFQSADKKKKRENIEKLDKGWKVG